MNWLLERCRGFAGGAGLRLTVLGLAGLAVAAAVAAPLAPPDKPVDNPKIVMLDELVDRYQPVPFEHKAHADMAEMWDGCETCHHRSPNGKAPADTPDADGRTEHTQAESAEIPACKSCHPAEAKDASIRIPSLKGAYHRQCLNCHKAWTGENNCVVCHEPRNGEGGDGHAPTPGDVIGRMHPPIPAPQTKVFQARYVPAAGPLVTFRHEEHVEQFGIRCVACHRRDTCASCHDPAQGGPQVSPVQPAISWKQSHEPCLACHNNQSCDHCHHAVDEPARPPFQHEMTGQRLDKDHRDLACAECHGDLTFAAKPTCGDRACHGSDKISFPAKRPGKRTGTSVPRLVRQVVPLDRHVPVGRTQAEQTHATDTIADAAPMPVIQRTAPRMTTVERPTTATQTCATEDCHVAVTSYRTMHGPVAAGACDVCHELVDEKAHRFSIVRQRAELCTYCHQFNVDDMPVVHGPTERGECLGCHNPHGGRDRSLTREESTEQLCNRCHESMTGHRAFLHTPVAQGDCVSCHPPHAAKFPKLLDAAGPDLCFACHDEFGKQLGEVKQVHKAMDEGCTRCHDVHGAAFANSLSAPAPTLCLDCHEQTKKQIDSAKVAHSPVMADDACLTCHTPHGGNVAGLMLDHSVTVCMSCHSQSIAAADGRVVRSMAHTLREGYVLHGPIAEGACRGCHTPHGGANARLLQAAYAEQTHGAFQPDQFALCFQCHDQALATRASFADDEQPATGFRNGSTNLHALHINQRFGRSCRVCHRAHASEDDRLVRSVVRFGQWDSALAFTRTETGGRCAAGCHVPFSYDRQDPIDLPAQRQVNEQAQRVRANPQTLQSLKWQGEDVDGQKLAIPHADHPTLLLIVRADAESDVASVSALAKAAPTTGEAQVVLLVRGEQAAGRTEAIQRAADPRWRIVLDQPDNPMNLDAVASPMALVVRSDGRVLTRIGGTPRLLGFTLATYLDLAAGRGSGPTAPTIVNGRAADQAQSGVEPAQYLRAARQLIDNGELKRAEQTLREAIALHPEAMPLQAEMVAILIAQHRPADALDLLDRLPADALPRTDRLILSARANIALDQWEPAEIAARQAAEAEPANREAQYLLGLIHEHHGDYQAAAQAYRAAHTPRN